MFLPSALLARTDATTPPSCKPFTIHSNVCVGDMIAIIACSVAGIGFFFWAIHAVRKMRNDPLNNLPEEQEDPKYESDGVEPFHVPSAPDGGRGVARELTPSERVRTRLALSQPDEPFNRPSPPISYDPYKFDEQGLVTTPRVPPRAGGQSQRVSSRGSSRHGSLTRGGPHGQGHDYGVNGEYMKATSRSSSRRGSPMQGGPYAEGLGYEYSVNGESMKRAPSRNSSRHGALTRSAPHGQGYEYGVNGEYMRNISPSYARVSPVRRSSGDYESRQSTRHINGDPTMYAY